MTTPDLDQIRTEIQHARESANRETNEPLNSINQALETLDELDDEPKPDRLESIDDELLRLQQNSEDETRAHLREARDHLRAYRENQEFLEE